MKHMKAKSLPQEHLRRKHLSSHYLTAGQDTERPAQHPACKGHRGTMERPVAHVNPCRTVTCLQLKGPALAHKSRQTSWRRLSNT